MNNKEFLSTIVRKGQLPTRVVNQQVAALVSELTAALEEEQTVSISSFGNFEVKKRLERVIVNPTTGQRMLVPPKLVVAFKPSQILKAKI
ncbi:MAG: HU family DNA-binding protein [Bacteroidaceae bacterium]|nr:HU family DNA-binding protein [Bacteroidaceae bacterium]